MKWRTKTNQQLMYRIEKEIETKKKKTNIFFIETFVFM